VTQLLKTKIFNVVIFLLLIIVCYTQAYAQEDQFWEQLPSPTSNWLNNLHFVDSLNGWACGEAGTIIHTNNGGKSWTIQNSGVNTYMIDIFFLNNNLGWALFWTDTIPFTTRIIKTTNGGTDWINDNNLFEDTFFKSIYFIDSLNGFMGGPPIVRTSDGGSSWIAANTFDVDTLPPDISGLPLLDIRFYNHQYGFACGGYLDFAGVIWWTTDSGLNWAAKGVGPDPVSDLYIWDSLNVIGLAGDPEGLFGIGLIRTTDGGSIWSFNELNIFGETFGMSFRTSSEGWAAAGDKFINSTDSGSTWIDYPTPGSTVIKDLVFTDSLTGYAVGDDGVILKYIPSVVNRIINQQNSLPVDFSLSQNYPNPFNPVTQIKYGIPKAERVELTIFNVLGERIVTLVNEEQESGYYTVEWNGNNVSSGVYLYTLKAGDNFNVRKMILLK
jgi:photosystem II stability/assembly factor-like uncharacterized protein